MEFQKPLCLFLTLISISLSSSHAYKFNVGGQEGWVLNPTESYNHWAERNRFLINDTLYFKYKKGSDSVLLVNEDDYSNCNTKHPFLIMVSGDSEFTFDRSGPFYFISGNPDHCLNGQKLIVVVLHPIIIIPPPAAAPTTTPSPSPCTRTQQPPQVVPPSTSQAPKGSSPMPATSPSTSPSAYPPKGLSPPAAASSPSSPPSSQSPSANSPSPAAATSPNASSPTATSPTTTPSSGNAPSPPSSTNPNTPADVTPPPSSESQTSGPSKSSAGATTSGLRMLGVSLLLGLVSSTFVGVN